MRKVELNMKEQRKYEIIKKLVETDGNKTAAALKLGCTRRTINRLIAGYKQKGKAFFKHGNKGRKPANRITEAIELKILTLYDNKYYDANFTHLAQLLREHDGISVSKSFLRALFLKAGILSLWLHAKPEDGLRSSWSKRRSKRPQKKKGIAFKHRLPASKKDIRVGRELPIPAS